MKDNGTYRKKFKEIWYETAQEKIKRKKHYSLNKKKIRENLAWITILFIFLIVLILIWIKEQNLA